MKKRAAPKSKTSRSSVKKPLRSASRKNSQHIVLPFSFQRIIVVTTGLIVFVFGVMMFNKPKVDQAVAGISMARGLFAQETVTLPDITSIPAQPHGNVIVGWNIYYKQASDTRYKHAVRKVPTNFPTYTISFLKKGQQYVYKVAALDNTGKESWWSEEKTFVANQAM